MITLGMPQKFKIDNLTALGCKRWQKNDLDRIYIGEAPLHQLLGIEASYYSTGNLSSFKQDDELLSNIQGNKILSSLACCKFYYDIVSDTYGYKHSQGYIDLHSIVYRRLDEYLSGKYDTQRAVKAEREITSDELDAALGL